MIYLTIEFWKLALDVIGISLCGITILHLIRNRSKYNQSLVKEPGEGNLKDFQEEVLAQLVKHQSYGFLETISNAIKKEQMPLHSLMEKKEAIKEEKPLSAKEPDQVQEDFHNKNSPDSSYLASDEYGEVSRLADLGLSVKKISERVKIPKGEVELIVKLKGLENRALGSSSVS